MFCIAKEGDLMLPEELRELAAKVRAQRAEAQFLEVKAAKDGCPKRLYVICPLSSRQVKYLK